MRTVQQSFLCRNIIRKDEEEVLIDREMLAEVLDFAKKDRPKHIMHRDGWTLRRPPPSPEQYIKVNFGKLTTLHAACSLSIPCCVGKLPQRSDSVVIDRSPYFCMPCTSVGAALDAVRDFVLGLYTQRSPEHLLN